VPLSPTTANGRDWLIERVTQADTVSELFAEASQRLNRLIGFDGSVWFATDPTTNLPSAPSRAENFPHSALGEEFTHEDCMACWEREFTIQDYNLYTDLAGSETPVGSLRMATGDRPQRSTRYRELVRKKGFEDELRLVLRVDGSTWAFVNLFRSESSKPFEEADVELLATLSEPLGAAVRSRARPVPGVDHDLDGRGPGLLVLGPDGDLVSSNDDALAWVEELPIDGWELEMLRPGPFSDRLPLVVISTVMRARVAAESGEAGGSRIRMRSRTGRWLVCHASCLRDADGNSGDTAVVIEPAKGSEIAPIIVQAYELSDREQEITKLIAQGVGTAQISERLHLSVHTVRDYVKAVFEKVGVASRGELTARMFAEHYAPVREKPETQDWVGSA
jgi:DNA-binding CsgD family transcriptional regulator